MPVTRTPRSGWIEEGLKALAAGGPDAVRIEPLAKALGVTKGGFYWHFDGRQALLAEMLDSWERVSIDEVIADIEGEGGDARARLHRLFVLASAHPEIRKADLAIRDWSRRDGSVAARVRRIDDRRMDYLRSLFAGFVPDPDEVEARCLLVMSIWVGSHFVAADHGPRSRAEVVERALRLLEAPPQRG